TPYENAPAAALTKAASKTSHPGLRPLATSVRAVDAAADIDPPMMLASPPPPNALTVPIVRKLKPAPIPRLRAVWPNDWPEETESATFMTVCMMPQATQPATVEAQMIADVSKKKSLAGFSK